MKKGVVLIVCFLCATLFLSGCSNNKKTDVDLTDKSPTIIYSEVYNMMNSPKNYLGKMIKIKGLFTVNQNNKTGQKYFACTVKDATACCSQGIEFELEGKHTYPNDYPAIGDEITVSGVFETYDEDGKLYCRLQNAKLE